jgi:hypothetical protein
MASDKWGQINIEYNSVESFQRGVFRKVIV